MQDCSISIVGSLEILALVDIELIQIITETFYLDPQIGKNIIQHFCVAQCSNDINVWVFAICEKSVL